MRSRKPLILLAVFVGALAIAPYARTQDEQSSQPSVADAARKAREQQKTQPKSAKVYTDEDLSNLKGQISIVGSEPTTQSEGAAETAQPGAAPAPKDEAYWRKRFADARRALADDQREADVLQREYGLKQMQFYPNPNVALQQQYSRKDLDDTLAELNAKKQDVEKDQQTISDLQDDLRKSGGEPGWANEPTSNAPSRADSSGSSASDSSQPSSSQAQPDQQNSPSDSATPGAQQTGQTPVPAPAQP